MLSELIQSLNKEELRFYKLYSQRYASGRDGLGARLLDLMRKDSDANDEEAIFAKLYSKDGDKNTYYRLKNRLQEDICDTLVLLHFGKQESNDVHRLICTYNILFQKGKFELAYYFIRKAEKKAQQMNNYELLDLVYTNIVKLSNEIISINPEQYVSKQSENAILLNRMRQMDQVLAVLNYRIKVTQNFQKGNENLLKLVDKTVKDFGKDNSFSDNKAFQIKIYRSISQAMVQAMKYKELEPYLLKTYATFEIKGWFDKVSHDVRLQMLVYLINTLFKNGKYDESLIYTKTLGEEIVKFEKALYDKYLFFYYNSLVINYSRTNGVKALATLDEFEKINRKSKNSYYDQFIDANKAMLLFDMHRYDEAVRSITRLYVNEHYEKADRSFKFKIEIAEVIMQYESGDNDTVGKRIKQIKKTYKDLLREDAFANDRGILDILQQMALSEAKKLPAKLIQKIKATVKNLVLADRDTTYAINYLGWLAPKVGLDPLQLTGRA